jgi:hypothetical protein
MSLEALYSNILRNIYDTETFLGSLIFKLFIDCMVIFKIAYVLMGSSLGASET